MDWNEQTTHRFDELRLKQITAEITPEEQEELTVLIQSVEANELALLTDYFGKLAAENQQLQDKLSSLQQQNEALAQLSIQQEQLVADARRWLVEFDQRNSQIQKTYTRLTNDLPLP